MAGSLGLALARAYRRPPPPGFRPRRVLVLKPCCLGDVLMSTAALAALRRGWPDARIDYAVGPWSRPALAGSPRLDGLVDTGPIGAGRFPPVPYARLVAALRRERYDLVVVLERAVLLAALPLLAGVPHRAGLDSAGRGFALTIGVPVEGVRHEADRYLDVVGALGLATEGARMEYVPTEAGRAEADAALAGADARRTLVAIHPGGGVNPGGRLDAKRWPPERFGAVARRVAAEGAVVAVLGGPSDLAATAAVVAATGAEALDLGGRLSIAGLGALLGRAALFVGNDTGSMHLAVAVGAPVVAIFGPTDPRVYGPYHGGESVAMEPPCADCRAAGRYGDCAHVGRAAEMARVWSAIERGLARSREGRA